MRIAGSKQVMEALSGINDITHEIRDGAAVYDAWPDRPQRKELIVQQMFPSLKNGCDRLSDFLHNL